MVSRENEKPPQPTAVSATRQTAFRSLLRVDVKTRLTTVDDLRKAVTEKHQNAREYEAAMGRVASERDELEVTR